MYFDDDSSDGDAAPGIHLRSPEDAIRIVRQCATMMCGGDVPEETSRRMALLFASVSKLTVTTLQAVTKLREDMPDADIDEINAHANHAMSMLIAGAVHWAMALYPDQEKDSWYDEMFSSN
jgi:hypothetical protein